MLRIFSCSARAAPSAACLALPPFPCFFRPCRCPLAPLSVLPASVAVRPSARLLVPRSAPLVPPAAGRPPALRLVACGQLAPFLRRPPVFALPRPVCRPPVQSLPPAQPSALRCWLDPYDAALPATHLDFLFKAIRGSRCCFPPVPCVLLAVVWLRGWFPWGFGFGCRRFLKGVKIVS